MKAMIVTILIPDDWTDSDICSACNIGIRKYSEKEGKLISSIDYNTMVIDRFMLMPKGPQ